MSFSYPPHLTTLAWVFSDLFYWLTAKCPHVIPKCEQFSYQYSWPALVTYNKSCEWCEVRKKNFPTRAPWTVFRPIIVDGKPSCPGLITCPYLLSYPGYFREPHWSPMETPGLSRVTWLLTGKHAYAQNSRAPSQYKDRLSQVWGFLC